MSVPTRRKSKIARGVSKRRLADREAEEVLGLLEAIEASAPVGLGFVDRDFRIIRINQTLAAVNGGTVEEQLGRMVEEVVPDIWGELRRIYESVIETGEPLIGLELAARRVRPESKPSHWLTSYHPVRIGDEIGGIGIVAFDITERKLAEEQLRLAKENAERLIETSNAIVLVLDATANITSINKAGEEITGYTREELQGLNWDIVVPRDRYPAAWIAHTALLETGLDRYEGPILAKSGEERIILWRNSQVVEGGHVIETVSFGVDITESVRAREEAIHDHELLRIGDEKRRRLLHRLVHAQEEERRRIAGEIHDDPIQVLAALGLNLDLITRHIGDPAIAAKLATVRETVRSASERLRKMIFRLHPSVLDREGLGTALSEQLAQIRQETGLEVSFDNTLACDPPNATSVIAFRIAQEAIVNVRKHAKARHLDLRVGESSEGITVRITDDGSGFAPAANEQGHLGLTSMRERAELAGGWLRIDSTPPHGTVVEFCIPFIAE